jgi:hypothetical protein
LAAAEGVMLAAETYIFANGSAENVVTVSLMDALSEQMQAAARGCEMGRNVGTPGVGFN